MKTIKSLLVAFIILFCFVNSTFAESKKPISVKDVEKVVKEYVNHSFIDSHDGNAVVITNFIIKENGENFAIDFMVDENDQVFILSIQSEEEYYRVDDHYNAKFIKSYSVPVSTIL